MLATSITSALPVVGFPFGTPVKLNTDATTRPQWQANISVSPTGTLSATWYDSHDFLTACSGDPNTPCYKMYSRKSNDNGLSWLPDDTLSDVGSPLPAQPDFNVQGTYAGDYDYGSAIVTKHVARHRWTAAWPSAAHPSRTPLPIESWSALL